VAAASGAGRKATARAAATSTSICLEAIGIVVRDSELAIS
jgi:hypothetical protein